MKGKVYLVGAGPGDPELLTLKALRVLGTAGAILHDDLVPPAILELAPATAQLHNVGKRCGTTRITQEEINFLMISLAGLELTVVRLKGGDPLIFGRAGEEIEALRRANVDYEVVPGVTAALGAAAAAGIPLTHRRMAHAAVFLTGQHAAGVREAEWRNFVKSAATLVIYMPHDLAKIASKLKRAGLVHEIPCALISHATKPDQQVKVTRLGDLRHTKNSSAPSLLIIGEVVRFARVDLIPFVDLAWSQFPTGPWLPAAARAGSIE